MRCCMNGLQFKKVKEDHRLSTMFQSDLSKLKKKYYFNMQLRMGFLNNALTHTHMYLQRSKMQEGGQRAQETQRRMRRTQEMDSYVQGRSSYTGRRKATHVTTHQLCILLHSFGGENNKITLLLQSETFSQSYGGFHVCCSYKGGGHVEDSKLV